MTLWPQYTFLALAMLDIGLALGKHGQPKSNFNVWVTMLSTALILFVLFKGGFFDEMLNK